MDQLISLVEAARRLGMTYHKTRNLVLTRKLPGTKVLIYWAVSARDVERLRRALVKADAR